MLSRSCCRNTRHPLRHILGCGLLLWLAAVVFVPGARAAEYLTDEKPVPPSVEDEISPMEDISPPTCRSGGSSPG